MLIYQLRHILVGCGDDGVAPGVGCLCCQCADDVIGFIPVFLQQWKPHAFDDRVQRLDLLCHLILHRRAIGFVLRIELVSERWRRSVEHNGNGAFRIVVHQFQQHRNDASYRAGVLPGRCFEVGQSVKSPKEIRRPIDKN